MALQLANAQNMCNLTLSVNSLQMSLLLSQYKANKDTGTCQ